MTAKNKKFFLKEFEKQLRFNKRFAHSDIGYGEDVMPMLELYAGLSDPEEMSYFEDAIEDFLTDSDKGKRNLAVNICLGFLTFRDAINHK